MHIPCTQITTRLHGYVAGRLPADQAAVVALHLGRCAYCRADVALLTRQHAQPHPGKDGHPAARWGWRGWTLLALGCMLLLLAGSVLIGLMLQERMGGWSFWRPDFRVEARRFGQGATQHTLQHWAVIFQVYSGENRGRYPPVAPYDGVWAPDLRCLYPDYLQDFSLLVSPKRRDAQALQAALQAALSQTPPDWRRAAMLFAQSYTYTGWHVPTIMNLERLLRGRKALYQPGVVDMASDHVPPLQDHDSDFRDGEYFLPRLREGVARFYITDVNNPEAAAEAARNIVVLFETPDSPDAASQRQYDVLYMDGHVGRVRYGAGFPMLPEVSALLSGNG